MKNLLNILKRNFNNKTSIEAVIKKIKKVQGTEIEEINSNELLITEEDSSLIEIDIIIDRPDNK